MVYKLVAHLGDDGEWIPVGKRSDGKATVGGRKQPVRALRAGIAVSEDIYVEDPPVADDAGRRLLADLVLDGDVGRGAPRPGRRRRGARRTTPPRSRELPPEAFALSRGEPVLPTRYL